MRVLLSTYGGRGDVEPLVGLAVRLRALDAEVRVLLIFRTAERLAEAGVPLVPVGPPAHQLVHGDNVRDYVFTGHPWLAADLDVVQTGAWILPDERPRPAELVAFLDAGTPPVYVG
jgi:Glycosyltransferase family 28 N-terminal domain